jgi:hypothetical protein
MKSTALCAMAGIFFTTAIVLAQSAPTTPSAPDAPKAPKKRSNVTIIKNGEVVYSNSDGKEGDWKRLEGIFEKEGDSLRSRLHSVMRDAGKRVHISSTNNTMTIMIDKDGDGDSDRNVVMQFSGDDMERWGREFSRSFGRGMNNFHFDTRPFQDMARNFRFSMPHPPRMPHAPNIWRFDDDDFESKKAEDLAEQANDLSREADAVRKEAEAMRLEAEAMKKRAEALRLEADARKNKKSDSKDDKSSSTKKK